jgi:RNA polymerase sigma-70 factor (ECF subfamily)
LPHALAYAVSLVRNRDLAEDLVHDCYCRLLQKASVYDLTRDGLKILIRSITNAAIDLQARQRVLRRLDGCDADDPAEGGQGDLVDHRIDGPVAGVMMKELEEALEAGLQRLPLLQRAALEMKSTGHSLREIAATLAITVSHAGVLIHRARQGLAQDLAPYLEDTAR